MQNGYEITSIYLSEDSLIQIYPSMSNSEALSLQDK
jgi:hypothetical protein